MITAMELADAGHKVHIFESRKFPGGKAGSWIDKDGNHIEMGLHIFPGYYYNLFGIMKRVGAFDNLLLKDHTTTFINNNGILNEINFRTNHGKLHAPWNSIISFFQTNQITFLDKLSNALALCTSPILQGLYDFHRGLSLTHHLDSISFATWLISKGGTQHSIDRLWNPIAKTLGYVDCTEISARCMLTLLQYIILRTEASQIRMLKGATKDYLHQPILQYLQSRNVSIHLQQRIDRLLYDLDPITNQPLRIRGLVLQPSQPQQRPSTNVFMDAVTSKTPPEERQFDVIVAATDVPGIQKLLPTSFSTAFPFFEKIHRLETVPIQTVQLRFDGWVTDLSNQNQAKDVERANQTGCPNASTVPQGINNVLYTPDAHFACLADLAVTSPATYYQPNQGSLLHCVLSPGTTYQHQTPEEIVEQTLQAIYRLFPSAKELQCTWWNVVKVSKALSRQAPGMNSLRPGQVTPIPNFFLAGSYTCHDALDSMEGATISGIQCAKEILQRTDSLQAFKNRSD